MRFRIAEPAVELDHSRRAAAIDHQPRVQKSGIGGSCGRQSVHRRADDLAHDAFVRCGIHHRRGRVCAHSAGVRPRISLTRRLVILRRRERNDLTAAHNTDEARFLAGEKLLDHDPAARVSERTAGEHRVDGGERLRYRLRDDHALARREAVRLDHDRRSMLANVGARLGGVGELGVACGGDAVACEERLGKCFRAFHPGGGSTRAEDAKPLVREPIGDARDQRRFRPDYGQVDRVLMRAREQAFDVLGPNRDVLDPGLARGASVAGRHQHPCHPLALREFPSERVLASAAAHHEHGERGRSRTTRFRNRSRGSRRPQPRFSAVYAIRHGARCSCRTGPQHHRRPSELRAGSRSAIAPQMSHRQLHVVVVVVDPPLPELRATEFYPSPLKPRPKWTHRRARPQSPAPRVWQPRRSNEPRREFRRLFV